MKIYTLLFLSLFLLGCKNHLIEQPITPTAPSQSVTSILEQQIQNGNPSADTYAELGLTYLQQVRKTGDAAYYTLAEQALQKGVELDPTHQTTMIGVGMLAASRHEFEEAIEWGQKVKSINPYNAAAYGILVDGYVELGQYDLAVIAVDTMVQIRPDLESLSRLSYIREIYGDVDGAIEAMQLASDAGIPGTEGMLWTYTQLGDLYARYGEEEKAADIYRQALLLDPSYPYAKHGQGTIALKNGRYKEAIEIYQEVTKQHPLPAFAWNLGDAYQNIGDEKAAENAYDLVRAVMLLDESNGMNVDLELVLFDIEHSKNINQTVANARFVYEARPTVFAADALAWALYQQQSYKEAKTYSDLALRLGTKDPNLLDHASKIQLELGNQ